MSLQTYADLQSAVANWLNRSDLTSVIPDLIALGEARLRRNQQWFRQLYSQTAAGGGNPLTITAQPQVLPDTVRRIDNLWASTALWQQEIEIRPISAWRDLQAKYTNTSGIPTDAVFIPMMDTFLESTGPLLYLWPPPDFTAGASPFAVDFTYIADVAPISTAVPTLFTRHPDLYLYAALAESAPFLQHDERIPVWETRYAQIVKEINLERDRAEFGGTATPRLPQVFG